jgi:hypothetical protein
MSSSAATVEQVATFMAKRGLDTFASAVLREAIDGEAVRELVRDDVRLLLRLRAGADSELLIDRIVAAIGALCEAPRDVEDHDDDDDDDDDNDDNDKNRGIDHDHDDDDDDSNDKQPLSLSRSANSTRKKKRSAVPVLASDAPLLDAVRQLDAAALVCRRDGSLVLANAAFEKQFADGAAIANIDEVLSGGAEAWRAVRDGDGDSGVSVPTAAMQDCTWRVSRCDVNGESAFVVTVDAARRRGSAGDVKETGASKLKARSVRKKSRSKGKAGSAKAEASGSDDSGRGIIDVPTRTLDAYVRVIAILDHVFEGRSRRLSFRKDESFVVLASTMDKDEWIGVHKGRKGLLSPASVTVLGNT